MRRLLVRALPLSLMSILVAASTAHGDTIRVPRDHKSIQNAVDAAAPGDTIVVQRGTYRQTVRVTTDGITIRGRGRVVLRQPATAGGATLTLEGASDVTVRGLSFQGLTSANALRATDCAGLQVVRCRFGTAGGAALTVKRSDGLLVERCRFTRIPSSFGAFVEDCSDAIIRRCRFASIGEDALFAQRCADIRVEQNVVANGINGGGALDVSGERAYVAENRTRRAWVGIDVAGGDVVVEGNTTTRSGSLGIEVSDRGSIVRDNRSKGSEQWGIALHSHQCELRGNLVIRSRSTAIRLLGDQGLMIDNRTVRAGESMYVEGDGNRVEANRFERTGFRGILVRGENNTFTGNYARNRRGHADLEIWDNAQGNTLIDNDFVLVTGIEEDG